MILLTLDRTTYLNSYRVDNCSAFLQVVGVLLNDNSPAVVGAASAAFASICPNNLGLIGKSFKRLCEILPDVEEWGQIILIGILLRYAVARHGLVRESVMFSLHRTENGRSDKCGLDSDMDFLSVEDNGDMDRNYESKLAQLVSQCYIEGSDEFLSRSSCISKGSSELKGEFFTSSRSNEDVKILLECTSPLLWSHNSAALLAAAGVHWIMAPRDDVKRIVKPLLFVLRSSNASKDVVIAINVYRISFFFFI